MRWFGKAGRKTIWLTVLWLATVSMVAGDDCWSDDDTAEGCLVYATIDKPLNSTTTADGIGTRSLSMKIHCDGGDDLRSMTNGKTMTTPKDEYLERIFRRAENLTLDGCYTPITMTTYGLEHIPNCHAFQKITIERFRSDELQQLRCPSDDAETNIMETVVLRFRYNEFGAIGADSLINFPQLREIYFERNSLRHLDRSALDTLPIIEIIHLENENYLAIKEADFLVRTSVIDVRLIGLKRSTPELFSYLPDTLKDLLIAHTPIDRFAINMTNPQSLRKISIVNCSLISFTLRDAHSSVTELNLSGNMLDMLSIESATEKSNNIQTLDLSDNSLTFVPLQWFESLVKLTKLNLRGNQLRTLSLKHLLAAAPTARYIDLSDNQLRSLRDTESDFDCDLIRIQIDRNPWNCIWLLDYAHTYPEKFRIFQYVKYISRINVNGLECVADEELPPLYENTLNESDANGNGSKSDAGEGDIFSNVSTYTLIYGSPWEIKRSQRTASLIIVFMLPVGIAFLFLLLYLWIHCQKIFHLSYYRDRLEHHHLHHHGGITSADRFDVVRQLPPLLTTDAMHNQGYEIPLNGIPSACNCKGMQPMNVTEKSEMCNKLLHVTYEAPPNELPHMLYEEIIEDNGKEKETNVDGPRQPIYDHLIFRDADDPQSNDTTVIS